MTRLEHMAMRGYAAIGIHPGVFDVPPIRTHALRLVRRIIASGFDGSDCMTPDMNPHGRREIERLARALAVIHDAEPDSVFG
jgi:hypothetical protein